MFESPARLAEDVLGLLDTLRTLAHGRYAVVFEPKGILFESTEPEATGHWVLRRFLEPRTEALFGIPAALASGAAMEDVFADWSAPAGEEEDEFYMAFLNGRVGLLVACPDAEALKAQADEPLRVLADRLLRYNAAWRLDEKGRGLFFGQPRLDVVVVGRLRVDD
ncbi:MAG TPA: hypothetical protein VIC87_07100 [Vicinamibacteria bacterium]